MNTMKYILVLLLVNISLAGCNSTTPIQKDTIQMNVQQIEQPKKNQDQSNVSEAIVVFSKGTTMQEAQEVIVSYKMQVLKVYKSISKSTQKPMLHISSSLPMEEMMQLLRIDSRISSISPNYKRDLD